MVVPEGGGEGFGFTVFGTSTSGGTHVSTERRWGARSGAGAATPRITRTRPSTW